MDVGVGFGLFGKSEDIITNILNNKLFDGETGKMVETDSMIFWKARETRTIDLRVMMNDNDDNTRRTRLFDVPNSTVLSIIRDRDGAKHEINLNLLQVVVNNQIVVFDLRSERPKEIFFFNATNQFMTPEAFVESGIMMA